MSTTIEMEYDNCCNVSKVPPGRHPNKLSDKCQCNVRFATEKKLCKSKLVYSMKLRLLTSDDISTLKELCMEWFPIKYPDSWYQHVAVDKRFYSLVATFEDKIIAILIAEIKPYWQVLREDCDLLASSFSQDTKVAYILSLGVTKTFRRQGVASYLLYNFISTTCVHNNISSQEVKAIYLHVLSTNKSAIQFYERHKFKLLHFLPAYYVIDGVPRDGFSYVLHVNGGQPSYTCLEYCFNYLAQLRYLQLQNFPGVIYVRLCKMFRYVLSWSHFSPFVSKTRQCHNL
ncbi:N-alpha-acetyltransferase 60-like [Clavelina lepadiformis]|uniref:N-alpha-acetyltransferase 60-like n=1 Tax=Clavelina lepadiformis TaxID=159417 RepID=UPI00404321A1